MIVTVLIVRMVRIVSATVVVAKSRSAIGWDWPIIKYVPSDPCIIIGKSDRNRTIEYDSLGNVGWWKSGRFRGSVRSAVTNRILMEVVE